MQRDSSLHICFIHSIVGEFLGSELIFFSFFQYFFSLDLSFDQSLFDFDFGEKVGDKKLPFKWEDSLIEIEWDFHKFLN